MNAGIHAMRIGQRAHGLGVRKVALQPSYASVDSPGARLVEGAEIERNNLK
jgi:hypothetical protein